MILTAQNIEGTHFIWFLELDWLGGTQRFATLSMVLNDADGYSFPYIGGLNDIAINSRMQQTGLITAQQDSVAIAITFENHNIAKEHLNGNTLDGAKAKIGYVTSRNGTIQQSFAERIILYSGRVGQPIYGHPAASKGYVEFSIDNIASISNQPLLQTVLGENLHIDSIAITPDPEANKTPPFPVTGELVNVSEIHKGKVIPFCFGEMNGVLTDSGSISIPMTPAYVVAYDTAGAKPLYYIIAGHATNATSIKCFDSVNKGTDTADVLSFVNIDQRIYSYFTLDQTSSFPQTVAAGDDRQVWVEWVNGGAYQNPFGDDTLSGAGDLLLFLLSEITEDLDIDAWNAARPLLNEYKFAGYVNDPKTTIMQFLQQNIIKYLPISIVNSGPRGLRPIISLHADGLVKTARVAITTGPTFYRDGPITTQSGPDEIINQVMIRFGKNGITNTYTSRASISNSKSPQEQILFGLHPLSQVSKSRYGTKRKVFDLDYCYDAQTAMKIANNIIAENAMPKRTIRYLSSMKYGYLEIGDILKITDDELGFDEHLMQVVFKSFDVDSWIFELLILDNPLNVKKSLV
ncbi:MAG: hypothetical protein VYB41_06020 [Bacteroidota bacterium]|nr:hypothetical protein [Bacteroidota bacterium]